jgi:hypothetical protein
VKKTKAFLAKKPIRGIRIMVESDRVVAHDADDEEVFEFEDMGPELVLIAALEVLGFKAERP